MPNQIRNSEHFDENERKFLEIFSSIAIRLGNNSSINSVNAENLNNNSLVEMAKNALSDILKIAGPKLRQYRVFKPFFAEHGILHPKKLAEIFKELTDQLNGEKLKELLDIDILLILFSSFVLHDIGMCILDENELKSKDNFDIVKDLWKGREFRKNHDLRSLKFIEEKLICGEQEDLTQWNAYWNAHNNFPNPQGNRILYLLARICQSHGDSDEKWLNIDELNIYNIQSDLLLKEINNKELSFDFDWETSETKTWKNKCLIVSSAFLSLCDLCDIGKHRFEIPNSFIENFTFPDLENSDKLESFYHWISHHVGNIVITKENANDGIKIVYRIYKITDNTHLPIRSIMFIKSGPVYDLYKYGSCEKLSSIFKDLKFPYKGIEISWNNANISLWNDVENFINNKNLNKLNPYYKINESLLGKSNINIHPIDIYFTYPYWINWCWNDKNDSFLEKLSSKYSFVNEIIKIRKSGLVLEECFDVDISEEIKNKRIFIIDLSSEIYNNKDSLCNFFLLDSFIASFKVSFLILNELLNNKIESYSLYIFDRTDILYHELQNGRFPKNSIIILLFEDSSNLHELKTLAETINNEDNIFLLVIPSQNLSDEIYVDRIGNHERINKLNIKILPEKINVLESNYKILAENCFSFEEEKINEIDNELLKNQNSPSQILYKLFQFTPELKALESYLSNIIAARNDFTVFCNFVLLSQIELMRINDEIKIDELKIVYEYITNHFAALPKDLHFDHLFKNFKDGLFIKRIYHDEEKGSIKIEDKNILSAILLKFREKSAISTIAQLMVLFHLQSHGKIYNVTSYLFKKGLPIVTIPANNFRSFIANKKYHLSKRLLLAIGISKIFSEKFDDSIGDIITFFSAFLNPISDLTKNLGIITFQMLYTLLKNNIYKEDLVSKLDDNFSNNPIYNLAKLEAFASGDPISRGDTIDNIVKNLLNFFINNKDKYPKCCIMAYDILWYYDTSQSLFEDYKKFFKPTKFPGWKSICSFIHKGGRKPNKKFDYILKEWAKLRNDLKRIIDNTPKYLSNRKKMDTETFDRMKEYINA